MLILSQINHIPNTANYCKKDVLVRYLRRMAGTYGSLYDFWYEH